MLALAAGAGCGSSQGSPADGSGGGAAGCDAYAAKLCEQLQTCAPAFMPLFGITDIADCLGFYRQSCDTTAHAVQSGWTPQIAQQCGDAIGAMSCDQFLGRPQVAGCMPHGGTVANGGSCNSSWQCASGLCDAEGAAAMCGSCIVPISVGGFCSASTSCANPLVCLPTAPNADTSVCVAPVAIGDGCSNSQVCPANAYCNRSVNKCTKLPSAGAACNPSDVIVCDPAGPLAFCDATTSTCVAANVALPGASCDASSASVTCVGICIADADASASTGTCRAFVAAGATCTATDFCAPGTTCLNGVCGSVVCDGTIGAGTTAAVARLRLPFHL